MSSTSSALALNEKPGRRSSKPSRRTSRASRRSSRADSHASGISGVSEETNALNPKDRHMSAGVCAGLDLSIFEQRKSRPETPLPPQTPLSPLSQLMAVETRPLVDERRPSEAKSVKSSKSNKSRRPSDAKSDAKSVHSSGEDTPRSTTSTKSKPTKQLPAEPAQPPSTKSIFKAHMEAKAKEAFQKRNKGGTSSFTDLDPPALPGHQLLPPSVRVLDVPTAMDFFDHHDKVRAYGNTGLLDKKAFAEMLFAIAQGKDAMSEEWSNAIFEALDFQGLGVLDQEQFLGWTFCTPNNYHSNIRLRFQQVVKEHQLRELLEALVIGNGLRTLNQLSVGKEELWFLVDTCRVPLSRFSADELHSYLANGAEGVDPSEFLNWLFPGRELRELRQKVDHLRQQQPEESEEENEEEPVVLQKSDVFRAPRRPLWEHGLQRPIIVEFRVAHAFMPKINYIEENLGGFSELRLEVNVVIDESLRNSCGHVVIKTGRDMIIWDTGTMTPYREDPFVTKASSWNWLKSYLLIFAPDANMAAQVGHLKKQKRRLKRAAARAAAARRASRASRHSSHRASSHASGDEHPGHHEHLQQ